MRKSFPPMLLVIMLVVLSLSARAQSSIAVVNAASYDARDGMTTGINAIFPGSIKTFTPIVAQAGVTPLPTHLGGVTVYVEGEAAPLFFVSPIQINCLIAERFVNRAVNVEVVGFDGWLHYGKFQISPALGVFSANSLGFGLAAAVLYDPLTRSYRPVVDVNLQPVPVDVGAASPNYLVLYGTGQVGAVSATIGGLACDVTYAGASGLIGAQQLNVRLRSELAGKGLSDVRVSVNGREVNGVKVFFK